MKTNGVPPPDDPSGASGIAPARTGIDLRPLKRTAYVVGAVLLAAALAFAVLTVGRDGASGRPPITTFGEWRQLAPESSWSIWRPACIVQSVLAESPKGNSPTVTLSISTLAGAGYLVGVSSDLWTDISDGENLSVNFGFDDEPPEEETSPVGQLVLGYTSAGEAGPGFHTGVRADFLHRMAESATMEVYRDGLAVMSIDLSGAAKALQILLACARAERAAIEAPVEELYSRPSD